MYQYMPCKIAPNQAEQDAQGAYRCLVQFAVFALFYIEI